MRKAASIAAGRRMLHGSRPSKLPHRIPLPVTQPEMAARSRGPRVSSVDQEKVKRPKAAAGSQPTANATAMVAMTIFDSWWWAAVVNATASRASDAPSRTVGRRRTRGAASEECSTS